MPGLRVVRSYRQHYDASAAEVFPMICPVKEEKWLAGFFSYIIFSKSGLAEKDCVFVTTNPGEPVTTWIITCHDREAGAIEFVRMTPGLLVTRINVELAADPDGGSTAKLTYSFTSLSPEGDMAIRENHNQEKFLQMARLWEESLNYYLRTGQTLLPNR